MRFWDSSAIVPLLVDEPQRDFAVETLREDPVVVAWWGTPIEVSSALSRREREGAMGPDDVARCLRRLRYLQEHWQEVLPSTALRALAQRLLRVHALRASDSLQLAAALIAAEREPQTLDLVSFDQRLNDAATREGFMLITAG